VLINAIASALLMAIDWLYWIKVGKEYA